MIEVIDMQAEDLVRELPKGLIKWYKFRKGGRALYVTGGEADEALEEALRESGLETESLSIHTLDKGVFRKEECSEGIYDYIVAAGALEHSKAPQEALCCLRSMLNQSGRLLLGMDNRLGIRYFCGDRDAFTERNFDGIENYVRIDAAGQKQMEGRAYSRAEIGRMLEGAGFCRHRFYSVLPRLMSPQVLYAEDYLPQEELDVRIFPQYNCPDTVFLEEERLYTTLIENGLFHAMANGCLVECPLEGEYANVRQVTVSMERGANAMFTIIRRDDKVEKRAVHEEGRGKAECLMENTLDLQRHGVKMVDGCLEEDAFVMSYVQGEPATDYFRKLLYRDKELFLQEMDRFWEVIQGSSEQVPYEEVDWEKFEPGWQKRKFDDPNREKWKKAAFGTKTEQENLGSILKRGYIDLISLNCFYINGEFVFYDQELYIENLPAKVILKRSIDMIYRGHIQLEGVLPQRELQERYRLNAYEELWNRFAGEFLNRLRNDTELASYYKVHRRDIGVINSNRQRMNYSENEYQRIFRDIFHNTEGRRVYLFGSGNFTKKFLSQFGNDCGITGILDNNRSKWGTQMEGLPISSPDILKELEAGEYKVIICIKNYIPVMKQLRELGVRDYGIFDGSLAYPRKPVMSQKLSCGNGAKERKPKKYHVGYIAGVFDLFHIGHLNMFRRAKEQCDYLIVGVVNDESVMGNKKTMPYIPFSERMELVRSCRYVDEAVEIPTEYCDTDEAYRRYQFDVQFSGSDYAEDPAWLAKKTFLQKQGSDMVFFPYTQSTSSTKLKKLIEKGLL